MKKETIKFIDLFAGIGGFHQGFTETGFESVMASEFDLSCQDVFEENYGFRPMGDITKISINNVPKHHILTAGFPCQPFSISGHKRGFDDTRGTLFFEICRIASSKNTPIIVLENVKHLIHHDKGNTLRVIIETLEKMGYFVSYSVLNAIDFDVPQNRERIIIVASKNFVFDFSNLLSKRKEKKTIRQFLEPNRNDMEWMDEKDYTLIKNPKKQEKSGLKFVGYRNKAIRKAGTRPNTEHLSRVHKQPNRIYSIDGSHPTLPSQESSGRFFIYIPEIKKVRKLTIRECYRIMGFKDDFKINTKKSEAYKQIGNSVCIPMVRSLALEIKNQLLDKDYYEKKICKKTYRMSQKQIRLI